MRIRKAEPNEYKILSTLAIKSKSFWGYSEKFMKACLKELTYTEANIKDPNNHFEVAEIDKRIVGFFGLIPLENNKIEMEALFVDPDYMRKGIGSALINKAKIIASEQGFTSIIIQGDPNAEKFYLSAGCVKIGFKESLSIPGRYLPMFSLSIK